MAARSLQELQKRYASLGKVPKGGPGGGPRGRGPRPKGKPKDSRATVRRLMGYIGAHWFRLIFVFLCMLCSTLTSMAGTYLLRDVYNVLTLPKDGEVSAHTESILLKIFMPDLAANAAPTVEQRIGCLAIILGGLGAIYAVGIISNYLQGRLMIAVSQNAVEKIRNDLFKKLQRLPVRFFDSHPTGELMSRFTNDVDAIDMMINSTVTGLISGAITLVGTLFMMIYTNWILTLITLVFIPLYLFGGGLIGKKSAKYHAAQQAALGAVNGYIEETVTGSKVVKVFNHEADCVAEFEALNDDMRDKQFKAHFYGGVMGPIMHNLSNLSFAVTAGVGGLLCIFAGFDVGGLTIFCTYARQFSFPINNLSMQMSTIFSALAGAERVFAVMDEEPETPDRIDAVPMENVKGEVILDDVSFGYLPGQTVLKHVSLYAHAGQKIAFVGSTGAGKTTVTNLLNRFYDIDEGTITIDGIDIRAYKRDDLRSNIAMVLQDTHLFTGTIMENIRYGRPDATDEEVIEAAKTASAHSFIMRLEHGYQTVLEGDGANLSQGQRQLLNIARAAISKAPILVLDEATSSVHTRTQRHI